MLTSINKPILAVCAIFASAALLISCDTTNHDDHDDHSDPFGVSLIMDGVEIAAQENGTITYNDGDHLELKVGEETNRISVRWIAEDGDRFTPDENDGYSLRWIIDNENVLDVEQHEEDGAWSFHLKGTGIGETTIRFELWHNNHADFTSQAFDVHVEESVSGMEVRDETGSSIVEVNNSRVVTGSLSANTGSASGPFTAVFLDMDGSIIDTDHGYELEWHIEEGAEHVTIEASTENPFSFTVNGVSAGQAQVHFVLVKEDDHDDDHALQYSAQRDDDGHNHEGEIEIYESPDITINVN